VAGQQHLPIRTGVRNEGEPVLSRPTAAADRAETRLQDRVSEGAAWAAPSDSMGHELCIQNAFIVIMLGSGTLWLEGCCG
jgi:hypothetical protein